jgi:hypothetical protein
MHRILGMTLLALVACTPAQDTNGTGTPSSDPADLSKLGTQIDKSDQRVAAAVTVARENADKPDVVRAETGVALAYLPKPDSVAVDYVRARVARNNPEEYKRAEDAGRKLLAVIDANFAKAEADALKNKQALDNANRQITALKAEVESVRTEGIRNAFAVGAGICFLAALAMGLLGQYLRASVAFLVGAGIGGLPYLFASPYFLPGVGGLVLLVVALVWLHIRKRPCPDAPQETPQG